MRSQGVDIDIHLCLDQRLIIFMTDYHSDKIRVLPYKDYRFEFPDDTPIMLPAATKLPTLKYIPDGSIIIIRFIRSDRILDIFSEKFKVHSDLVYSYVKAVIDTSTYTLSVNLGDELVETIEYSLPLFENDNFY